VQMTGSVTSELHDFCRYFIFGSIECTYQMSKMVGTPVLLFLQVVSSSGMKSQPIVKYQPVAQCNY
jgi:hypothetical protein